MFVDASAIVAIICGESDATELAQRLAAPERRFTSPVVRLEACMVLASKFEIAPSQANALFDDFLDDANLSIVAIDDRIGSLAVACFEAFGKHHHSEGQPPNLAMLARLGPLRHLMVESRGAWPRPQLGEAHAVRLDHASTREVVEIPPGVHCSGVPVAVAGKGRSGGSWRPRIARREQRLLDLHALDRRGRHDFIQGGGRAPRRHAEIARRVRRGVRLALDPAVGSGTNLGRSAPSQRREGRASKVNHPSQAHRRFDIPAPKTGRRAELRLR